MHTLRLVLTEVHSRYQAREPVAVENRYVSEVNVELRWQIDLLRNIKMNGLPNFTKSTKFPRILRLIPFRERLTSWLHRNWLRASENHLLRFLTVILNIVGLFSGFMWLLAFHPGALCAIALVALAGFALFALWKLTG